MAYPPAPPAAYAPPVKQSNGFGVAALVLGLISAGLCWIPLFNLLTSLLPGLLAVIFGIVGIATSGKRGGKGKGTGITGLILGVVALAVTIAWTAFLVNAFSEASDQVGSQSESEFMASCQAEGSTEADCQAVWDAFEEWGIFGG
ncbi:hypothetical protein [Glycomyces buryatensis]|uniref:DUF4190 domain-containing protein n=1 Tax=Glycomyces buryatensis TaxID=2570927 RepID=A0A4S8QJH3_9ACTN|nr:hypothetical protein [Glycomyces buryatensis]THV43155.1 hypothetical protein FAB82_02690 [Glycomyces buryatensis]